MKRMPDGEPKLSENQMFVGRANIQEKLSGKEYIAAHPDYPIIERPIVSPREAKPISRRTFLGAAIAGITALGMEGCFQPVSPTPTPEVIVSPTPQEGLSFTSEPAQLESFFEGLGVGLKSRCAEVADCVSKEVPMVGSDNYTAFKIVGLEDSKNTPIDVYMFLGKDGKTETKMVTWLQNPNNPAGVYTGQEVIITENGLEFKKDAQGNYVPFGEFDMQGGKLTKLSITAPNGESYDAVMNGQGDAALIGYYTGEASPTPTPPPPEAPTVTPTEAPAAVSDMTKEELGEYSDGIKFEMDGQKWKIMTSIKGLDLQGMNVRELKLKLQAAGIDLSGLPEITIVIKDLPATDNPESGRKETIVNFASFTANDATRAGEFPLYLVRKTLVAGVTSGQPEQTLDLIEAFIYCELRFGTQNVQIGLTELNDMRAKMKQVEDASTDPVHGLSVTLTP